MEDNELRKWDSEDLATVRIKVLQGHSESVNSCQFIQNTQKIFSASEDCSIRLWNFRTGKCIQTYDNLHEVNIPQAHSLPDGSKFLTCGWDKKLKLWDAETGQCILEKTHEDFLTCCQVSHDEKMIACGSDLGKALRVYDLQSGECIFDCKGLHESSITSCKFAPADDKVITTSMDRSAKFFDLVTGTPTIKLVGHTNIVSSCSITSDERKFATASWDKSVLLWDVATGMYRSQGPSALKGAHDGSISCCSFSADGLFLVTGSYDLSVVVWDVENSVQKMKLQGHFGWINDICFSEDQDWLLSCSKDKTVRLWNIADSDKIPIVLENKKAQGVKVIKCSKCAKPFSMSQLESFRDVTVCVFCRLASPEKSWLSFSETSEQSA
ncbi:WD repeat-containing protein 88 [Aplysia californica]|uniref:WD repeat-containing protein 88 n=1 Tax=Aplysia californica TaxID=6500 RepID=A0ABM0JH60_APLCA|nr:WD repeat-containing protein 88 [Aplysia californica]